MGLTKNLDLMGYARPNGSLQVRSYATSCKCLLESGEDWFDNRYNSRLSPGVNSYTRLRYPSSGMNLMTGLTHANNYAWLTGIENFECDTTTGIQGIPGEFPRK